MISINNKYKNITNKNCYIVTNVLDKNVLALIQGNPTVDWIVILRFR